MKVLCINRGIRTSMHSNRQTHKKEHILCTKKNTKQNLPSSINKAITILKYCAILTLTLTLNGTSPFCTLSTNANNKQTKLITEIPNPK